MKSLTKVILISLIGFIISACLLVLLINPGVSQVIDQKDNVILQKTQLKTLEQQLITYKNSQIDLARTNDKQIIFSSLLNRENLQLAIEGIEAAAVRSGTPESLIINEDSANNQKAAIVSGKAHLDEIRYTLSTTSNFMQMIDFLKYLEHLPYFTEISKISLQAAQSNNSAGGLIHSGDVIGSTQAVFFVQKP